MKQMSIPDALYAAADYIETHGWRRINGWDYLKGGGVCMEGALCAVLEVPMLKDAPMATDIHLLMSTPAYNALADFVFGEPWRFNNAPGTTKEDVLATLRACAALAQHELDLETAVSPTTDQTQETR